MEMETVIKDINGKEIKLGQLIRYKEGRYGVDGSGSKSLYIVSDMSSNLVYAKRVGYEGIALINPKKAEIITELK